MRSLRLDPGLPLDLSWTCASALARTSKAEPDLPPEETRFAFTAVAEDQNGLRGTTERLCRCTSSLSDHFSLLFQINIPETRELLRLVH